ncbi:MAG: hypothetical protein ACRD37_05635 [Candidatus Acidiferrales bacterium]
MKSSISPANVLLCSLAVVLAASGASLCIARARHPARTAQTQSAQSSAAKAAAAAPRKSARRFDMLVRDDFFAGMFNGNQARFDRALKFTENALAKDPKNGDAWVWLGSAHVQQSSQAYTVGDSLRGKQLWDRGLKEMDKGVALDPNDVGVHIGRGAPLLGFASSGYDPTDPEDRAIVKKAVGDFEFTFAKQAPYFNTLGRHSRGELLFGLASGWSMLGNDAKARDYLARIARDLPRSPYATEAQTWLAKKPLGIVNHNCIGCHTD